jgi:hypothetical protein
MLNFTMCIALFADSHTEVDRDGYSVGATQEHVINLYGDNESFPRAFDTGVIPVCRSDVFISCVVLIP